MTNTTKRFFIFFYQPIFHFGRRAKETPALLIILSLCVISQIIVGYYFYNSVIVSLLLPIGNLIFLAISATAILFFSDSKKEAPDLKHPILQTFFIFFAIAIVFFWFLGQFPNHSMSNNYTTTTISHIIRSLSSFWINKILGFFEALNLNSGIVQNFSDGLHQFFVLVIFPFVLLSPFFKTSSTFKNKHFNWKLMTTLLLIYVPFIFFNKNSFSYLFLYFISYILIAFSEEYLFRVLLQSRLENVFRNKLNSIAFASLIFGIIHIPINSKMYGWPDSITFCLGINTFGSLMYGYIYYKTRSLWLVTIVHAWSGTILM
jgi:membrane protease YdiL (CAAX protease family)